MSAYNAFYFFYPLFMFIIAGFIFDKIQPNMLFALKAFIVAGGGFFFVLILNTFLFPGGDNVTVRSLVILIYTPIAYLVWLILKIGNRKGK